MERIRVAKGAEATETFVAGNTLQLKDYSKNDWPWTMFNLDDKIQRQETVFPEECKKVFEMGKRIFQNLQTIYKN